MYTHFFVSVFIRIYSFIIIDSCLSSDLALTKVLLYISAISMIHLIATNMDLAIIQHKKRVCDHRELVCCRQ